MRRSIWRWRKPRNRVGPQARFINGHDGDGEMTGDEFARLLDAFTHSAESGDGKRFGSVEEVLMQIYAKR